MNQSVHKNKKTIIFFIVGIAIAFVLGLLFGGRQTNIAGAPSSDTEGGNGAATSSTVLPVSIVTNHDASAPLYKLSIEYPQFPSAPSELNDPIKNFVATHLADFKQSTQENWTARQETMPSGTPPAAPSQIYYFSVSWTPSQLNTHYISFILRMAAFVGGANEDQEIMTFNYDLLQHKAVSLADFFPTNTDYLSTVSKLAREQLTGSLQSAFNGTAPLQMMTDGTTPIPDNFKNFVFDDDVITFYFPKYQVAPGSAGEQHVSFVRSALTQ